MFCNPEKGLRYSTLWPSVVLWIFAKVLDHQYAFHLQGIRHLYYPDYKFCPNLHSFISQSSIIWYSSKSNLKRHNSPCPCHGESTRWVLPLPTSALAQVVVSVTIRPLYSRYKTQTPTGGWLPQPVWTFQRK